MTVNEGALILSPQFVEKCGVSMLVPRDHVNASLPRADLPELSGAQSSSDLDTLHITASSFSGVNAEATGILPLNTPFLERRIRVLLDKGLKDFACFNDSNCSAVRWNLAAHVETAKGLLHIVEFEPATEKIARYREMKLPKEFRPRCKDHSKEIQFVHWLDGEHLLAAVMNTSESRPDSITIFHVGNSRIAESSTRKLLAAAPGLQDVEAGPCITASASFEAPYCVAAARGHFEVFQITAEVVPRAELVQSFTWNVDIEHLKLSPNGQWLLLAERKAFYIVRLTGAPQESDAPNQPASIKGAAPVIVLHERFNEPIAAVGFRDGSTIEILLGESGLRTYEIPASMARAVFAQLEFPQWQRLADATA